MADNDGGSLASDGSGDIVDDTGWRNGVDEPSNVAADISSADMNTVGEKSSTAGGNAQAEGGEGTRDPGDADENDSPPPPPAIELSPSVTTPVSEAYDATPSSPGIRHNKKQLEKLQRRVPGSLDLDYITPQLIGMAPPRAKEGLPEHQDVVQKSLGRGKKKRQKGNDPGELSTFLERRHPRRYLLFNVSDEDADDRSLLLLGRQVVHLPWGSPRIPHPHDNTTGTPARTPGDGGSPSPYTYLRKGSEASVAGGNKSSGTPAVSRVMDICHALHAYLSVPPGELPEEVRGEGRQSAKRQRKGKQPQLPSTVACVYCGNGKTRTGVIAACYLRFCNEVPDALSGFEIFCERRGIMSSSSSAADANDISSHIPPSLRQFFGNFDEVVQRKHYPYPEPLMLQSIHLQGVPVDDMPCVDIWEHGDVIRRQIYSSHDDVTMNEWDDEEGSYKIGQLLDQDFTLVCRFGGEFAGDADDPSKVLFRYVNCPNFVKEGTLELGMADVDMMRRYADSFDDEDFLLTLTLEGVDDEMRFGSPGRKRGFSFFEGATKFDGNIREGPEVILQGWRVLSDAHLSHLLPEIEEDLELEDHNSFKLVCQGREVDFRLIAMQFTNGDAALAKSELVNGLFKSLFGSSPVLDPALGSIQMPILEPLNDVGERRPSFEHMGSTVSTAASTIELDDDKSCNADDVFEATLSQLGNGQEGEGEASEPVSPVEPDDEELSDAPEPAMEKSDADVKDDAQSNAAGEASDTERGEQPDDQSQELPPQSDVIPEVESDVAEDEARMESLQSLPSIEVTETEESPLSNNAFADQSHSSLLEAIQMRGLKKSMVAVGGDEQRSSLLMEIRRSGSSEKAESVAESLAMQSSTIGEDVAAANKSGESGPADYLPSSLVVDTAGVVDCESLDIDQSDTSDRAVMMVENDESLASGNDPKEDNYAIESAGFVAEHTDTVPRSPLSKERKVVGASDADKPREEGCPASPSLKEDPLFDKFYQMLQQGLPVGEVQSAMQRDKVDPTLLDFERLSMSVKVKSVDGSLTLTSEDQVTAPPDNANEDSEHGASEEVEKEDQRDPRAALTAMLNQSVPPSNEAEEQRETVQVASSADRVGEDVCAQGDEPEFEGGAEKNGPRAALTAMFSKRAGPTEQPESTSSAPLPSDGDGIGKEIARSDQDEWVPLASPRNEADESQQLESPPVHRLSHGVVVSQRAVETDAEAWVPLAAVPSERAPSSTDSEKSESGPASPPTDGDVVQQEEEQRDPRTALMTMLSQRAPPAAADDGPQEGTSPTPFEGGDSQENATVQSNEEEKDPRAALMAMLSKRAPPTAEEDQPPGLANDTGDRVEPDEQQNTPTEEVEQPDSRAALMAAINQRVAPANEMETQPSAPTNIGALAAAAAMEKTTPEEVNVDILRSVPATATGASTEKGALPTLKEDPRFEKYYKMLRMGLPVGAVKNAMLRDQQDPTIMDLDPEKSLESQRPSEKEEGGGADDGPPLSQDPAYEKFFKMLRMGIPLGAVKNGLQRDGLDPGIMDLDPNKSVASQLKAVGDTPFAKTAVAVDEALESQRPSENQESVGEGGLPLDQDPTYEKYYRMLRMGLSLGAVKNAMQRDGIDPGVMDASQPKAVDGTPPGATAVTAGGSNIGAQSDVEGQDVVTDMDPRAALTAMLSKRAPPAAEDQPTSTVAPGPSDANDALNAMLSNRGGPTAVEQNQEATQADPMAALMAAITKRASPTPAEQQANVESSASDQSVARIALNAMLTKRGEQDNVGGEGEPIKPEEDAQQQDPQAALMAAITKRASPPLASEASAPPSGDPMNIGALAAAAALKKQAPAEVANDSVQPAAKDAGVEAKEGESMIREDPRFAKYFKMLRMGLPMGAVKNAMQRDQQDPTIMDLDPDKSLKSQRPAEKEGANDDGLPLNQDPAYAKYFKMLKMGLPMGAVKNAMQRDGLDPSIMDLDHEKSVASQLQEKDEDEEEEAADDGPPLKEDPKYNKYYKMLKMGLPMGAVKNALQRDGLDPSIMDLDPEKSEASQRKEEEEEEEEEDTGPPLKDDPKYSKYYKMLKMGLPMGAVKNALTRDGLDPSIMDLDPEKSEASQLNKEEEEEEEPVDDGPPLKEDPKWSKYFKMLKMGLPMGAVKNALTRDGHDASIMDFDHDKSLASQTAKPGKGKKAKKKIGKMLKSPLGPKKPKVRRKKIFWSPIEESKIDDNSLWSMVKGTFDFDSLKIDQEEFQSLFTDSSNPADKKKTVAEKPAASKQKKSVQVIDAKRGMNGGIILARIKIEFSVLADMVTEMDCGKLDDTQLKALREFLPTKDETFAIEGYIKGASSSAKTKEAAINDLCACEKYMLAMMKVDMADEKFEAMLFKYQFDHKLKELMDCVTTLIDACEEVQKSVRLRKLMAMILMLGNQINTGGSGRMAQGFTLDALLKLDESKAFDKKTSVLQYLVKLVKANEPDLLNVHEEMPSIGPAENVMVDTLVSELKELNDQLVSVKGTAEKEGRKKRDGTVASKHLTALERLRLQKTKIKDVEGVNMYNQSVPIQLTAMEKFALYAEKRTREAFARIDEVQENFKGVLTYFGEDPAMSSSDFFGTLNKFIATFDSALEVVKRIEALKIAEEKKAAAKRAREAVKKTVKAVSVAKHVSNIAAQQQSDIVSPQQKGKLDLAGQRKTFADPFTGPGTETKKSEEGDPRAALMATISQLALVPSPTKAGEVKSESQQPESQGDDTLAEEAPKAQPVSSPSGNSDTSGFFPATTRDARENSPEKEDKTARAERYDTKTSSNARGSEAVFASPPSSPVARGIKHNVLAEQKTHLHHVLPNLEEEESSDSTGDSANDGQKRMNRINPSIEADAKTEAKVMLVASMAAAAAKKRSNKPGGDASDREKEVATLFNSVTVSKSESAGEPPTTGEPTSIGALAAAAALKKSAVESAPEEKKSEADAKTEESLTNAEAPSIAALAAAAALKKSAMNEDSGIDSKEESKVASVATSAATPSEEAEEKESEMPLAPAGVAAMAAAAALQKAGAKDAAPDGPEPSAAVNASSGDNKPAKPAPSNDPPKGVLYPCSACGEKLEKGRFSKNQLNKAKKNEKARCKQCIEASSK
ncbi:hypothetical protein ACHAXT_008652 [Thalassiosira profunda]